MEKRSFAFGFLSAAGLLLAAGLWLHDAPLVVEAATSDEVLRWCQTHEPFGAGQRGFDLKNTWAVMTANMVVASGHLTEKQAREQACEILYNIHHPEGN